MHGHVLLDLLAYTRRLGLAVASLHVRDDAFEGVTTLHAAAVLVEVAKANLLAVAAVKDDVAVFFGQLDERGLDVEAVVRGLGEQWPVRWIS